MGSCVDATMGFVTNGNFRAEWKAFVTNGKVARAQRWAQTLVTCLPYCCKRLGKAAFKLRETGTSNPSVSK